MTKPLRLAPSRQNSFGTSTFFCVHNLLDWPTKWRNQTEPPQPSTRLPTTRNKGLIGLYSLIMSCRPFNKVFKCGAAQVWSRSGIENRASQSNHQSIAWKTICQHRFTKERHINSLESTFSFQTNFHSATWGFLTVENWKTIEATYEQGLRCIHAETTYAQLKHRTRTNLGVQVLTIHQAVSSRRLGLLKRVLDSNSEWLLGLIVDSWTWHHLTWREKRGQ